jgi:ribosomal protein S16
MLGWYQPFQAEDKMLFVNAERVGYWLEQGAQISDQVKTLIAKAAPDVLDTLNAKRQAKRTKLAAKRRALKKAKTA